jgi:signal transduction histidine kinase
VDVTLGFGEDHLTVTVENSPCPGRRPGDDRPDGDHGGEGFGLRGMRERVGALGGDVQVVRRADGGFVVTARLPAGGGR